MYVSVTGWVGAGAGTGTGTGAGRVLSGAMPMAVGRRLVGWGKVGDLVGFPGVTVGIGVGSGLGAEVRMMLLKSSACTVRFGERREDKE